MRLTDSDRKILMYMSGYLAEQNAVDKAIRYIDALEARIALASEIADNCSGDYMRAVLSGEIDRAEHERRVL